MTIGQTVFENKATYTVEEQKEILQKKENFSAFVDEENINLKIVTHEFAHTLSDLVVISRYKDIKRYEKDELEFLEEISNIKRAYDDEKWQLVRDVNRQEITREEYKNRNAEIFISQYADTNLNEFMAEAFANAKLNSNPSKYSLQVLEVIDKYFKKKKE